MNPDLQYILLRILKPQVEQNLTAILGFPIQFDSVENFKKYLTVLGKETNETTARTV